MTQDHRRHARKTAKRFCSRATIDRTIMRTAGKLLHDPAMVEIAHKGETADTVEQYVMHVQQAVKPDLLQGPC